MRLWTILGLLALCGSVLANGCWDFSVDALYFKPIHCPITFATALNIDDNNDDRTVDPFLAQADYDWGFRVSAEYTSCALKSSLSYAYLHSTNHVRVNRGDYDFLRLQGQVETVDFADTTLDFRWQQVDLKGYHQIHNNCGCSCSLVGIIRWADVEMKNRTAGVRLGPEDPVSRFLDQSSCFDGVGLGAGVCGDYCLPCNLRVGGHLDIAALIGDRKVGKLTNKLYTDRKTLTTLAKSNTVIVPNMECAFFINYIRQVCCRLWTLELGYELHYFLEPLRYAGASQGIREGGNEGEVPQDCHDVGFAGPYLSLSLSY